MKNLQAKRVSQLTNLACKAEMNIFSKPPPPEAVSDDQGRSPHCTQFAISKALENGHSMGKFGPKIVLSPDSGEAQSKFAHILIQCSQVEIKKHFNLCRLLKKFLVKINSHIIGYCTAMLNR